MRHIHSVDCHYFHEKNKITKPAYEMLIGLYLDEKKTFPGNSFLFYLITQFFTKRKGNFRVIETIIPFFSASLVNIHTKCQR